MGEVQNERRKREKGWKVKDIEKTVGGEREYRSEDEDNLANEENSDETDIDIPIENCDEMYERNNFSFIDGNLNIISENETQFVLDNKYIRSDYMSNTKPFAILIYTFDSTLFDDDDNNKKRLSLFFC